MRSPATGLAMKVDLAVVGAGAAGLSVAAGAARLGLSVVLFEKGEMGGECLNVGCVPSKALIAVARRAQAVREAARFGVAAGEPRIDWAGVRAHVANAIEAIAPNDSQARFEGLGVVVIREAARFRDPETLISDSCAVRARRFVLATGSRPAIPNLPGLEAVPYLTNETVFDLAAAPKRLIVLGAGPMGVELGQAFRRLGSEVALVEPGRALARADARHAREVIDTLRAEGVEIIEGAKALRVDPGPQGLRLSLLHDGAERTIDGDHLLLATGRRATTTGLDLEAGGIAYDANGVKTNAYLRTTNPRVWALGDATAQGGSTHAAGWHASAFVRTVLFKASTRADAAVIPWTVYADPELAQVGLTEEQARATLGAAVTVTQWRFADNDRAVAEGRTAGEAKLIVGAGGRLVGASIVGDGAGETIQLIALAMANGLKARALTNLVAPYPTRGEIVKRLAGEYFVPTVFGAGARRLVGLLKRLP